MTVFGFILYSIVVDVLKICINLYILRNNNKIVVLVLVGKPVNDPATAMQLTFLPNLEEGEDEAKGAKNNLFKNPILEG